MMLGFYHNECIRSCLRLPVLFRLSLLEALNLFDTQVVCTFGVSGLILHHNDSQANNNTANPQRLLLPKGRELCKDVEARLYVAADGQNIVKPQNLQKLQRDETIFDILQLYIAIGQIQLRQRRQTAQRRRQNVGRELVHAVHRQTAKMRAR